MSRTIVAAAKRRPWTSFGIVGFSSSVVFAGAIETRAERLERRSEIDPSVEAIRLPRKYDRRAIRDYWIQRPISIAKRFGEVLWELAPVLSKEYFRHYGLKSSSARGKDSEDDERKARLFAAELREALTNLGPAWVKGGQQLAIRPDLVPPAVLYELQKLCDSVRPIADDIAFGLMKEELGVDDLSVCFEDLELVASASLGQVYKAKLRSGENVAIKVQRPGMQRSFSLDLFLLQQWGEFVDTFTSVFTAQAPYHRDLFDNFSNGSYSELDYENEAMNQMKFKRELAARKCKVLVPEVYNEYTTQRVLTSQWVDGVKLSDSSPDKIKELIPVGVELFLTQLLDIGAFHADPHPGNLLVTTTEQNGKAAGMLCLLDFGLCVDVDSKSRVAMTKAIVHLLSRDFDSLVSHDAKELGFLPSDFDTDEIKPLLVKVLTGGLLESGSNLGKRRRKFQEISNELNEIFFRYPFQVPPFFALVTRGLGLLEGIALTGDPEFDIFRASVPYATRRAVSIMG